MATVQRTRPRAVVGAPRRAAWQLKSALRHSISAARRTKIFLQQFEIHKLFVCTEFQSNESRNFRFWTQKLLQKFGVKSGLIQKRLKYGKKYFTWLYVVRYSFISTYTFSHFEFFFLFPFFAF